MLKFNSLIDDILGFWFGRPGQQGHGGMRALWWQKDPALDEEIRSRYLDHYHRAVSGDLDSMAQTAEGTLALILLLDQFSRNMFRGRPESFTADARARKFARGAREAGFDQAVPPIQRMFFYLPFEHSEILADQDISLSLFEALPEMPGRDQTWDAALRHREIIARFGRFPHRNEILGRKSTPEEIRFLKENSSF